jgi:hypothetical protein
LGHKNGEIQVGRVLQILCQIGRSTKKAIKKLSSYCINNECANSAMLVEAKDFTEARQHMKTDTVKHNETRTKLQDMEKDIVQRKSPRRK